MKEGDTESREDEFVNYMPGMPTLSGEPGRVERFLTGLFRRRRIGSLKLVLRNQRGE